MSRYSRPDFKQAGRIGSGNITFPPVQLMDLKGLTGKFCGKALVRHSFSPTTNIVETKGHINYCSSDIDNLTIELERLNLETGETERKTLEIPGQNLEELSEGLRTLTLEEGEEKKERTEKSIKRPIKRTIERPVRRPIERQVETKQITTPKRRIGALNAGATTSTFSPRTSTAAPRTIRRVGALGLPREVESRVEAKGKERVYEEEPLERPSFKRRIRREPEREDIVTSRTIGASSLSPGASSSGTRSVRRVGALGSTNIPAKSPSERSVRRVGALGTTPKESIRKEYPSFRIPTDEEVEGIRTQTSQPGNLFRRRTLRE